MFMVKHPERKNRGGEFVLKVKVKVKVNFTLEQATKVQRESKCTAILFL
jgi:hypothetical protein